MTTAKSHPVALALVLMAAAPMLHAQTAGGSFATPSNAELQAQRTAQLLAATQQRQTASPQRDLSVVRLNDNFVLTRPMQREELHIAQTQPLSPPPRRVYGSSPYTPPAVAAYSAASSGGVIPAMPDARPGECFALVKLPERFNTYEREYELRAASERIETLPPRFEDVTEQYVAQEAYEQVEVLPASFRMVTEQVEVAAPSVRYEASEPIYETVTERVLQQPARTVWKPGSGPIQRIDHATGDIMCLIEEPAIYKNVTRRVLKAPAEAREVPVPGQYTLVNRRVLDRPAEVRRVQVPQQIATRTVRKMVEPGAVRRVAIPAEIGSTTVRELVEPTRLEWRSVLCETNMTSANIQRVQSALLREGFNPGPVNGRLNEQTLDALNHYQRARKLPEDRYLNMETVRALGVM
ncbi:MAG: peptidoglycan-binding protein [Pseudomonadota bacterium]